MNEFKTSEKKIDRFLRDWNRLKNPKKRQEVVLEDRIERAIPELKHGQYDREKYQELSSDPDYYRSLWEQRIKAMYGITPEDVARALDRQDRKCAICMKDLSKYDRDTCIDHCHKTGKFRGILCQRCNKALGFMESINYDMALKYLKNSS